MPVPGAGGDADEEKVAAGDISSESGPLQLEPPNVEEEIAQQPNIKAPAEERPEIACPIRNRAPPQRHGHMRYHGYGATFTDDPTPLEDVTKRPDGSTWKEAMDVELNAFQLGAFSPTKLPSRRKDIPYEWVFAVKRNETGELFKYSARVVAKGFCLIAWKDFDEVFAPVSKHATFSACCCQLLQAMLYTCSKLTSKLHS